MPSTELIAVHNLVSHLHCVAFWPVYEYQPGVVFVTVMFDLMLFVVIINGSIGWTNELGCVLMIDL